MGAPADRAGGLEAAASRYFSARLPDGNGGPFVHQFTDSTGMPRRATLHTSMSSRVSHRDGKPMEQFTRRNSLMSLGHSTIRWPFRVFPLRARMQSTRKFPK